MKFKEIYVDDSKPFADQRLRYRVGLLIEDGLVILKREHFRAGFLSGESDDHFYVDSDTLSNYTHFFYILLIHNE